MVLLVYAVCTFINIMTCNAIWSNVNPAIFPMKLSQGQVLEFTQFINHQNKSLGTFQQRYYIDTTYYDKHNGPLYHIIGDEGSLESMIPLVQGGPPLEWTKKNSALQVILEHRYYGVSFPTKTYSVSDLKWLTIDQALDDIKYFMDEIKSNYSVNGISMLMGCSYPGALAAWSKIKYPDSYDAIIAGSAPVHPTPEYSTYWSWFTNAFNKYGLNCWLNMKNAAEDIVNNLVTTNSGRLYLKNLFNLCSEIPATNNKYIIQQFIFALLGSIAVDIQYDDAYLNFPTGQLCALVNENNDINDTLHIWSDLFKQANRNKCYDYNLWIGGFNITDMKNNKIPTSPTQSTMKTWGYQLCTQMGFVRSMHSGQSIFGVNGVIDLEYLNTVCTENGINIPNWSGPNVPLLYDEFYDYNISEYISNTFFSFGSYDPYRYIYTQWFNPSGKNVYLWVHDEAHCAMYYPETAKDTQSIKNARTFLLHWLSEFN
eukprot:156720_1